MSKKFSSNVNDVTRAVLNFSFFFTKRLHTQQKTQRAQKAQRRQGKSTKTEISELVTFFPLDVFYAHFLFLFACSGLKANGTRKLLKRKSTTSVNFLMFFFMKSAGGDERSINFDSMFYRLALWYFRYIFL